MTIRRRPIFAVGGRSTTRSRRLGFLVGRLRSESGQTRLLLLLLAGVAVAGTVILAALGQGLGGKGRHQRGADLAAISAAREMRAAYPRLFAPPLLPSGLPNPRHLPRW